MDKVYCNNCYYHLESIAPTGVHICTHPENCKFSWIKEDFLGPKRKVFSGYESTPQTLNVHNDCKWFKKQGV